MAGYNWSKMANFLFIFSLLFLFLNVNANECNTGCKGKTVSKEGFLKDHSYTYALEGFVKVFLTAASKQETEALISAKATVYALGDCSHLLKVTAVQFTGPDGKKYAGSEDFLKPIQFNMQNGIINSHICTQENDSEKSLNIKRAILSMLQTATDRTKEWDIFGACPTVFVKEGNTIHKKKSLNSCKWRGESGHDALYQLYSNDAVFKSHNILNANLKSEIRVDSGIVQSTVTQEDYLFKPFSIGQSGAKALVSSRLELKETKEETLSAACVVPNRVTFVTPKVSHNEYTLENIQNALQTATQYLDGHVQAKSASFFAALVRILRGSNAADIYKVYTKIVNDSSYTNKDLALKVFLDALFRSGTGDSIEVTTKLINEKQLNPLQKRLAFASLTGVRYASVGSLKAVTDLLDSPDLPNEVYLGAGALAAAHYRDNVHDKLNSSNNKAVIALSDKLVSKLGNCKATNKENENMMITVLKALKNIKKIEDNAVEILEKCASDKTVKQRVRVAAIEAFTAEPSIVKLKTVAYNILEDTEEDSELRIKAYLALVEDPTKELNDKLETLLDSSETIQQVGSFIMSSLINIQGSKGDTTRKARRVFSNFNYTTAFPLDARKYSQALQSFYEFPNMGANALVQSNVIYSQNSFVPRSVNLNLTAEVFGKDINLIEFGVRQDNLNRILEEYFGPKGTHKSSQQKFDSWKETASNVYDKIHKRLNKSGQKTKRDVQEQIATLGKKLKTDISEYGREFDLDVVVKLFGSEAVFLSLGDDQQFSIEKIIDRLFDYMEGGIDSGDKFSHEVRSHILFLDMELMYPTSSGMSLQLNAEGAITSKVTFGGDLDFRQLFGDILNANVDFKVMPSASVEVIGTFSVDADGFSTGLKTTTNLQTSTGVHITGKFLDGKGFDVKFGLPLERQEIITATNDVVFYTREKGHTDVDKNLKFNHPSFHPKLTCNEKLAKTTGLTICVDYVRPKKVQSVIPGEVKFPLNGPYRYLMYLDKAGIKSYNFRGIFADQTDGYYWEMTIDAEGAKLPTKFITRIDMKNTEFSMSAILDSPIKRIETSSIITYSDKKWSVGTSLVYGEDKMKGEVGFEVVQKDELKTTLKPILEIVKLGYETDSLKLGGVVLVHHELEKAMLTFDGITLHFGGNTLSLDGTSVLEKTAWSWDLKGAGLKHTASSTGKFSISDDSFGSEFTFKNSYKPQCNILYKGSIINEDVEEKNNYDISASIVHGPDPESKLNVINYNLKCEFNVDTNEISLKETFTYPLYDLKSVDEFIYVPDEKFFVSFDGKYKDHTVDLVIHMENNGTGYQLAQFRGIYDGIGGEFYLKTNEIEEDHTKLTSHLLIAPDKKYEVVSVMKGFETSDENATDILFNSIFTFPDKDLYSFDFMFSTKKDNYYKMKTNFAKGPVNYFELNTKVDNINHMADGKVFFKDIALFKFDGAIKQNIQKVVSTMFAELYKLDRTYQLEVEVANMPQKIVGEVKLYTDFKKDKTKLYRLTSTNDVTAERTKSKNILHHGDQQTKLNMEWTKSESTQSITAEIVDRNEDVYKISASKEEGGDDELTHDDYQVKYQMIEKNGPGMILEWISSSEVKESEQYANTTLFYRNNREKDLSFTMQTKDTTEGNSFKLHLKDDIYYKTDIVLDGDMEVKDSNLSYALKLNVGEDRSLALKGYFIQEKSQFKNYVNLVVHVPEVQIESENSFDLRKNVGSKYYTLHEIQLYNKYNIDGKTHSLSLNFGDDVTQTVKYMIQYPDKAPFSVEVFNKKDTKGKLNLSCGFIANMNKEEMSFTITGHSDSHVLKHGDFSVKLALPEKLGTKDLLTNFVYTFDDSTNFSFNITTDLDGKAYNRVTIYEFDKDDIYHIDINIINPDSVTKRFYLKTESLSSNNFHAHTIIQNIEDFNMEVAVDGKFKSIEDFKLVMDVDCAKGDFNKIHFEAVNELQDKQQNVKIVATEMGESLLDGIMTYKTNTESNELHITGSGKLKLRGKEENANLQYSHSDKNNFTTFEASVGPHALNLTHHSEKNAYKFITSYCKDGSNCAKLNLQYGTVFVHGSKTTMDGKTFEMGWDLRKLGLPTEFGLSLVSQKLHKQPMYSLTTHITKDDHYYEIQNDIKSVNDKTETFMKITIPTREIHLTVLNSPFLQKNHYLAPVYGEVILYMDKKDPKSKTHFKTDLGFVKNKKKQIKYDVDLFFVHPGMSKEWQVLLDYTFDMSTYQANMNATFDIFKEKDQKLEITGSMGPKHTEDNFIDYEAVLKTDGKGLGINYYGSGEIKVGDEKGIKLELQSSLAVGKQNKDYKFLYSIASGSQEVLVTYPAGNLLHYKHDCDMSGDILPTNGNWNTSLTLYDDLMYSTQGNIDWHDDLHVTWKGKCENMVSMSAMFVPGKKMEVSADYTSKESTHPLISIGYDTSKIISSKPSKENMRKLLDDMVSNWKIFTNKKDKFEAKNSEIEEKFYSDLHKILGDSQLEIHSNYFHDQTATLTQEFKADNILKRFVKPLELYMASSSALVDMLSEIIAKTISIYDGIYKYWQRYSSASFSLPMEVIDQLVTLTAKYFDPLMEMTVHFVAIVDDFIEKYVPFIDHWFDFIYDIYTTIDKFIDRMEEDIPKIYSWVSEIIRDSFPARIIDGRFKFLANEKLEKYLNHFEEAYKNILPEKEWNIFKKKVLYYNDAETYKNEKGFKETKLKDVVRSAHHVIVAAIRGALAEYGLSSNHFHFAVSGRFLSNDRSNSKNPKKIALIKQRKQKTVDDIFYNIIQMKTPNHLILPDKLRGSVIAGEYFITFDGTYFNFPGNCKYVIAHDAVDGNFSITMEIENTTAKSVRLDDKSGSWAEVDNDWKVTQGPGGEIKVIERENVFMIKSSYGVTIKCQYNLDICNFKVSGYYYGKLRGLLGDGNSDQVDDFRIPNGKIVSSEYDFANEYSLSTDCIIKEEVVETAQDETAADETAPDETAQDETTPDETEPDETAQDETASEDTTENSSKTESSTEDETEEETTPDMCSEIFADDSDFSDCYAYEDPEPYKSACTQIVAKAPQGEEKSNGCLIARAYAITAKSRKCEMVTIPSICHFCEVDGDEYDAAFESVTVKTPSNKADIVIVVEMTQSNRETFENVVVPVAKKLLEELETRNVDDTDLYLYGLKQDVPYPILHSSLDGNMTFDDKNRVGNYVWSKDFDLPYHTNISSVDEYMKKGLELLQFASSVVGIDDTFMAYWKLRNLQLRPNATRTFIIVHPRPCPYGVIPVLTNYYDQYIMKEEGAVAHLFSYMPFSNLNEHPDIVGFNKDEVYSIAEKPSSLSDIDYPDNECAKFALGTHGNIYSTRAFAELDTIQKEKYLDVAVKSIADSITGYEYEKECSCEVGLFDLLPKVTCETVSRKKVTVE